MLKKVFVVFFIIASFNFLAFSNSADAANRRTAVRYLQLAKQYASQKNWSEAENHSKLGLAYDEKVSDLWYIYAVSQANRLLAKADIMALVENALKYDQWVDYNKENAQVLVADLLCATLRFEEALKILDSQKMVYSSDAEYIRCRCYYNLGGSENISKAREKIDSSRRVFPLDVRFLDLFFKFEYKIDERLDGKRPDEVQKIADAFLNIIPTFKNLNPELEVYASFFADKEKRGRMLKSYNARGNKCPLYAIAALENDIFTQEQALDYYLEFAQKETDLALLEKMMELITEENSKDYLAQHLNAYNGTIYYDTDGDLVPNMCVKYLRGRAQEIYYDENQDDVFDWTAECDFGAPILIHINEDNANVHYDNWPYVKQIEYHYDSKNWMKVNLIAETMSYSPFGMAVNQKAQKFLNCDFYFPFVNKPFTKIDDYVLKGCALDYEIPANEKDFDTIKTTLLNGIPQIIRYYKNDNMRAQAQCENGRVVTRIVDTDGDGLFETTEYYDFNPDIKENTFYSKADEFQIVKNVFGVGSYIPGFYLKMIQIDQNGDTIPEFIEEYTENEGKISSWDYNVDGQWDTRYVKYPRSQDNILREESLFHEPITGKIQSVLFENSIPVSVKNGDEVLAVMFGAKNLYWVARKGSEKLAREILKKKYEQGLCEILEYENERVLVIQIGNMIFAEPLEEVE